MKDLIAQTETFVFDLFATKLPNTFVYHNFNHTKRVVKSTKELIENSEIHVKEHQPLILAAWLHDTGYTQTYKQHEDESIKIAREFLTKVKADPDLIESVCHYIEQTKSHLEPKKLGDKIIKDADYSHLAKDYFEDISELLRQELKLLNIKNCSPTEWIAENIELFTMKHQFYTPYAVKNWKIQKEENLLNLLQSQQKLKKKLDKERVKAKLKAKYKSNNPDRGIQTLYRTALRNHIKLSDIADTKANILLSVNAIIISLALANIIPKLDAASNRHLMMPTLVLVCFSVASMILSIMSTRPNVGTGEFTKEQVKNREVNILFFGNFHKMQFDQYKWAIDEILKDNDYIYEALTKDLYLLGIVLNRKYKLLRWTYTIFMTGIIISVIAFTLAFSTI
ncbi:Pycsar system effector family protein [Mesonia sp. HuA40]|uniref:Pycsar system effector family protein n=1 Tax=Mesonia sp. HuA40 TaxID=2602761 RepID=UPI0011C71596|nr:Pycsar system effector family protein [Mesonia sp. HuA40]TXK71104.1 HD domain-containing protein [Mesonia sp. HuA40]